MDTEKEDPTVEKKVVVTNIGPDQQDDAKRLAHEHARQVAGVTEEDAPTFIRGTIDPEIIK